MIELRWVQEKHAGFPPFAPVLQYRFSGSLGMWSDWQNVETVVVEIPTQHRVMQENGEWSDWEPSQGNP